MKTTPLKNKRYISLLRCSTGKQAETSIPDQKALNDAFAKELGMIWVRDYEAPGVSASRTFSRRDLDKLIEEAAHQKNFDVLLVHDFSRLTRGGIRHAAHVRRQFERVGVRVISANDNIPEGDEAEFFEAFIHWKNKTYAKNLGQQAARGSRSSLEAGRRPHCSHTPFGFDRLYVGPDGKGRCILRQIDGQTRHLIDCATGAIRVINPDEFGHFPPFQKQKDEISKLILGAPEKVDAVRTAFEMRYKHGRSCKEIVDEFHRRGIKPLYASCWEKSTVASMLQMPIYLGRAVACKLAYGMHVVLAAERPQPSPVDQDALERSGRRSVDPVHRPREEWWEREETHLLDYITDPVVRERALAAIARADEKFNAPKPANYLKQKEARREAHRMSPYILRDSLRAKGTDFAMRGVTMGPKPYRRRTYAVSAYARGNPSAAHLSKYVPAVQLETVVLDVFREAFGAGGLMRDLIRNAALAEAEKLPVASRKVDELKKEDQTLGKRIRKLISESNIDGDTDEEDERLIAAWKTRREQVRAELAAATAMVRTINIEEIIASVSCTIFTPQDRLNGEGFYFLRNLVNAWCFDMEVDIHTRELTFAIGVPPASQLIAISQKAPLCPEWHFTRQCLLKAQSAVSPFFQRFRCFSAHASTPHSQWPHKWSYEWEPVTNVRLATAC